MNLDKQLNTAQTLGAVLALLAFGLFFSVAFGQTATVGIVKRNANLRSGPGTSYTVTGQAAQGQMVNIVGQSTTWYQLAEGQWIAGFLVNVNSARTPTPTIASAANATAKQTANLRAGPGTTYAISGSVVAGQQLTIVGSNANRSWLQLANGAWIAAFLVNQPDNTSSNATVTVPRPTATPAPPKSQPTALSNSTGGNRFVLIEKRLWNPYENGGSLDGPSVHCGQGRQLVVNVLDANGNRLNGVAVQVQYGARETYVTGSQGKGDGVAEFVLGSGQDVKVIRDVDGSPATSDVATGISTNPANIPFDILMSAQYCQDAESCKHFGETYSCEGHFSWTVTFKRQ